MPIVSVVIPTFNGAGVLDDQLGALAREPEASDVEVIVSDNGSRDGTIEIANAYRDRLKLVVVDSSQVRGQTYARNFGVVAASSDCLMFLDQDDMISPGYIGAMTRAINQFGFVASRMETSVLNEGWRRKVRSLPQQVGLGSGGLPWAYGCTLGMTRHVFDEVGGFDTTLYRSAEDVDFCWRAAKAGIVLTLAPEALLHYRFPTTSLDLFRQGYHYGVGQTVVDAKHPDIAVRRPSPAVQTKILLQAAGYLAVGRAPAVRGRSAFRLGRVLGYPTGQVRFAQRNAKARREFRTNETR